MKNIIKTFAVTIITIATIMTVSATASAASFVDVSDKQWYAPAVEYCNANGYMSGTGAGKFDPNGRVSRAQMAQILYNFAGKPDMSAIGNPFNDVPNNSWYAKAVLFAKSTGIVNGTSSTTYSPNAHITREQVAVMLMGYWKSCGFSEKTDTGVLDSYTDGNKISSWAQNAVAWALNNKIMSGTGNSKLDPKGTCTRAQLAQFIKNYCTNCGAPSETGTPVISDTVDPVVKALIGDTQPLDKDWLPVGGYVQGGRKYNMYGIDVTDVDGIPTVEEVKLFNLINDYRAENGLPTLKWSQHAQILAEVRAHEGVYLYNKSASVHARPDSSSLRECETTSIGANYLTTKNIILAEELKATDNAFDKDMASNGKTVNPNMFTGGTWLNENLYSETGFIASDPNASRAFTGWKNSPGHNGTMLNDMSRWEISYAATAMCYDPASDRNVSVYDAYGLNWTWAGTTPVEPDPEITSANEWNPANLSNWNQVQAILADVPDGTCDYEFEKWLRSQNILPSSDSYASLYGAWTYGLSTEDVMRNQLENYYVLETRDPDMDALLGLTYEDMAEVKYMCAVAVGDKLVNGHASMNDTLFDKCRVCNCYHDEHYAAGVEFVNRWFMDTYGIDVSEVGYVYGTCTEKTTGKTFEYDSVEWYTSSWMQWQEWLEEYSQAF